VGYYTMAFGRASMYGKELGINKPPARERWLFACFVAGLCHDLGKVADVRVATDDGLVWSSDSARLMEWAAKNQVEKYYVDWQGDRHKIHESITLAMLGKVLTDKDREYISEFDKELSKQVMIALTPSSGVEAPSIRPYNIRDLVQKADQRSVQEDKKKSRTPADLGLERPTPLIRHYHDGMQRLIKSGRWKINESSAAVWVMGPDRGLYLVWPRCGMELYELLREAGVEGSPAAPEVIADILAENDLLVPAAPGDYYWRIKPADMDGLALTVLRINPKFAPNLVNPFPSSLSGLVQTDGGESSWTYIEADGLHEQASENSSGKIIPLHHPDTVMEIVNYDRIIREPGPGNPGPEAEKAPIELPADRMESPEADKPSKQEGWLPIIITVFFHVCLIATIAGAILIYMKNQIDPEVSYKLSLWMMMGNAIDTGLFVKILLLGLMGLGIIFYFRRSMQKVRQEEQKAGEIIAEAQEILDKAKKEAIDSLANARREGGEIKKTAKEEAADIRIQTKQEAAQEAEAIRKQAEADAAEVRENAERDAKGKKDQAKEYMNQLWSSLEGKAIKEGVPPGKLPELLKAVQKAEKDAEDLLDRAEIQAKEATEDIISEAKAEAAKIITQAQDQARRETEEALRKAKVQLADIYDQVRAAKSVQEKAQEAVEIAVEVQDRGGQSQVNDQSIQDNLPEDELSPQEDMQDPGEVAEQVGLLEERICGILSGQHAMRKRDLERKGNKSRYVGPWKLAMSNLLSADKIVYDPDKNTYSCQHRCQHELFQEA
jgi:vacuolar-type H+-ATPase subunit H